METLRSPVEIMTLFFILSIGFYIFLFWRSQVAERRLEQELERMRIKRPSIPIATGRRLGDDRPISENTFSRIFEGDKEDGDQFTTH